MYNKNVSLLKRTASESEQSSKFNVRVDSGSGNIVYWKQ